MVINNNKKNYLNFNVSLWFFFCYKSIWLQILQLEIGAFIQNREFHSMGRNCQW